MKLTNLLLGSALVSSTLFAGGDIVPVEPIVEAPVVEIKAWSYEFEPYMLIASMTGNAQMGRTPTVEIDMDFGDILEKLDIGAMGHFEAKHKNGWGIWIDYGFMDLSSDIIGPIGGVTDARMRQGTLEAFAMYSMPMGDGTVDYLAGIRWWDNDIDVAYNLNQIQLDVEIEEDWVDPVVGARWTTALNDEWKFMMLGTVGGFGVGSDLSLSGAIGVKYVISDLLDLDLQYKALWADYESGTKGQAGYFAYDVTSYGSIIGLNFKW